MDAAGGSPQQLLGEGDKGRARHEPWTRDTKEGKNTAGKKPNRCCPSQVSSVHRSSLHAEDGRGGLDALSQGTVDFAAGFLCRGNLCVRAESQPCPALHVSPLQLSASPDTLSPSIMEQRCRGGSGGAEVQLGWFVLKPAQSTPPLRALCSGFSQFGETTSVSTFNGNNLFQSCHCFCFLHRQQMIFILNSFFKSDRKTPEHRKTECQNRSKCT